MYQHQTRPLAAPLDLQAGPTGWQHYNSFRLNWREPLDQSGIAGVFVRFDSAPTTPTDGQFYAVNQVLEGLQTPGEGQHSLYVWLQDQAGNSDHRTAVALQSALWYDGLPPMTAVTVNGALGRNGWYLGPVAFAMTATDAASGLAEIRWQIDDGAWNAGAAFTVAAEGQHVVRIASADRAGNTEDPRIYPVNIDQRPPQASVAALNHYQAEPSFSVAWDATDPLPGSGLAGFDVQVRHGLTGTWVDWLTATSLTRSSYQGQPGHSYAFRVHARDQAGNLSAFSGDGAYTIIETVQNGSFDAGVFSDWNTSGLLRKAVVPTNGPAGGTVLVARLGTPEYGPSVEEPGQVPVGNAAIAQTIAVPARSQVARPTLSFWYRVLSYDVLYSVRLQRYVDDLEVWLYDTAGEPLALLLRDGNPTEQYGALYDSGWRFATVDLSQYAGQTVQLVFANYNREDNLFNTWSFVDQVQVQDWPFNRQHFLPLMSRPRSALAAGEGLGVEAGPPTLQAPSGRGR